MVPSCRTVRSEININGQFKVWGLGFRAKQILSEQLSHMVLFSETIKTSPIEGRFYMSPSENSSKGLYRGVCRDSITGLIKGDTRS